MSDAATDAYRSSREGREDWKAPASYSARTEEQKVKFLKFILEEELPPWRRRGYKNATWFLVECYHRNLPTEGEAIWNIVHLAKKNPKSFNPADIEYLKEKHPVVWEDII